MAMSRLKILKKFFIVRFFFKSNIKKVGFKGTVSRDFRPSDFFTNQLSLDH
jgi:hypothetical protein